MMESISVLFARRDSVYKQLPGLDVYDADRDARTFSGPGPVIAHPPCRGWGRLRHFAKISEGEKELAIWSVEQVRKYGGVLEHPAGSTLWKECELPAPGHTDHYGGWTLPIVQMWWGHRANKPTWLYIVGISPKEIPPMPIILGEASHVIASTLRNRPEVTKAEREHTPINLATWLVDLAKTVQVNFV